MNAVPTIVKALCFVSLAYVLLFSAGCDEVSPQNENGALIGKKDGDKWIVNMGIGDPLRFRYVIIDGHTYLIMFTTNRGGLTHSPKCPCSIKLPKRNH